MPTIDRRTFLQRTTAAMALSALSPLAPLFRAPSRPNLLYIMSDDLGYGDLGVYGRTDYATPVLDALAREGVRLTQAYCAAPVCTPTRVALNTGRYPARMRVGLFEPLTTTDDGLLPEPPTLARLIRDAGYETALIGKWHLGLLPEFHPLRHGYDEFYGFLGAAADYASHVDTETHRVLFQDGHRTVTTPGYLTDLFTERAVQFIRRPRTKPFFLNLEYNAPHWPWQAPGDPPHSDTARAGAGGGPPAASGGSPATYAKMVRSMDDGIGRILGALRDAGRDRDTLIIFASDNGGERYSDMGPFSHGKMSLYEGGLRTPAFARWPGVIAPNTTTDQVAITMDWTATLLARAGAHADPRAPLDGVDLLPALTGATPVPRDLYWRIFQRAKQKAFRSGDWKYIVAEDGEHLFDLPRDPGEKSDVKDREAPTLAALREGYAAWEREMLPPVPLNPAAR
ncbi:MAG: sulfatase-like hydrolase/transferase [Gemmatimonadaceae bacterium]|nr:sulfatase-like hydrolase/transferase [Gemmatimonadaceae bacterium]NUP57612.1 sulfatase-like hydrolase/transferase [Gemmatimonadaceae bacterium]NUP71626.1 sulfatase-like hydrolase/transferase [Gemmatimonadaceae bacterium]NUS47113.1 sulfatase-like hydrolase/transferase [Gemmatimonadaceae bacterium]